jgi:hypothetical protein
VTIDRKIRTYNTISILFLAKGQWEKGFPTFPVQDMGIFSYKFTKNQHIFQNFS